MADQPELLADTGIDDTLVLLAHADVEDVPRHRWPSQLAALVDVLVALYQRRGRDADAAEDEAREVVLALALYFGGRPFYLPKGELLEKALLHARIWHEFNGRNIFALADRHDMTPRQVQKIIAQQLRYRRGLRQGKLSFKQEG